MYKFYFHFILTLNLFMVQSSEIFTKEFSEMQNQLFTDVLELKEGLQRLQVTVDVLNKWHSEQLNALKDIISPCAQNNIIPDNDDVCEEILFYSNETATKYDQFNNKLKLQMAEIQRNQIQNLDEIIENNILNYNCQDLELKPTTTDSLVYNMEEKLNQIEQKLNKFEIFEKKLSSHQIKYEKLNKEQMKILEKIRVKLNQNEEKFNKYQKEVPDMNNFSNKINNMATWRHWRHRHSPRQ
ncbi:uncharacterized protein ACRADG_001797 [Cochliomyia hominivorax]